MWVIAFELCIGGGREREGISHCVRHWRGMVSCDEAEGQSDGRMKEIYLFAYFLCVNSPFPRREKKVFFFLGFMLEKETGTTAHG